MTFIEFMGYGAISVLIAVVIITGFMLIKGAVKSIKQDKLKKPQKPMVLIEANGLQWYYCPNCHKLLAYSNSKNPKPNKTPESCPQCEQKINWGQEQ